MELLLTTGESLYAEAVLAETDLNDYEAMLLTQEAANIENLIGITAGERQKIDRAIFEMFERLMERG